MGSPRSFSGRALVSLVVVFLHTPQAPGAQSCSSAPFSWGGFGASGMCVSTLHFLVEGTLWPVLPSLLSVTPGVTVSLDSRPVQSDGVALPAALRPWTACCSGQGP